HVNARAVTDLDEPHRLEFLQRFANRWMSNAEPARHFHDRRPAVSPLIVTFLNHGFDSLRELIRQALLEYGAERVSHFHLRRCSDHSEKGMAGGLRSATARRAAGRHASPQ